MKRNALGRGLEALISMDDIQTGGSSAISEIPIAQITPNPDQPDITKLWLTDSSLFWADSIGLSGANSPAEQRAVKNENRARIIEYLPKRQNYWWNFIYMSWYFFLALSVAKNQNQSCLVNLSYNR